MKAYTQKGLYRLLSNILEQSASNGAAKSGELEIHTYQSVHFLPFKPRNVCPRRTLQAYGLQGYTR